MAISGTLRVDPDKLISAADAFKSQGNTIQNLTQQMLQTVTSLNGSWEGEAQNSYFTRFKALEGDMNQIQQKINEHVSDLQEMAQIYKGTESGNAGNISGLATDYIS